MALINLKDANGKDFSVDLTKIQDINGDIGNGTGTSVSDSVAKNRVAQVKDVEYIDQNGQVLDSMKLLKDMQDGKTKVYALDVEMEATHSGKNHNYCVYYEDSMEKDAESFVNPFKKPVLKNHNDYSGEPLGRIKQAYYGPSNIASDRGAIFLKTRITDADAIPKFLDGRYSTVSISGTMGTVECNVCGKTILKDGNFKFCGHWRGEVYKDQMCYWGVKDIEYKEVSTVNTPADDFAQITRVTVITDTKKEEDSKQEGKHNMDGENNTNPTTSASADPVAPVTDSNQDVRAKLLDAIDNILGSTKAPEVKDAGEPTAPTAPVAEDANKGEKTIEDLKKENETLTTTVADLTSKLEKSVQDLATVTAEKEQAIQDAKTMKDQFIELAKSNREMVVDQILEHKNVEDSEKEKVRGELAAKSMKDLMKDLEDSKKEAPAAQRTQASVENPALANTNEPKAEVTDSNGDPVKESAVKDNNNKKQTVDDYANDIIGRLVK